MYILNYMSRSLPPQECPLPTSISHPFPPSFLTSHVNVSLSPPQHVTYLPSACVTSSPPTCPIPPHQLGPSTQHVPSPPSTCPTLTHQHYRPLKMFHLLPTSMSSPLRTNMSKTPHISHTTPFKIMGW